MARRSTREQGLSLLEILVSAVILAVGVTATFECLGSMARAQKRTLDEETMQRLAFQTYDKVVTENTLTAGQQDGDFVNQGEPRYSWHAEREPAAGGNLDIVRVEVAPKDDNYRHAQKVQGLVCRPKETSQ